MQQLNLAYNHMHEYTDNPQHLWGNNRSMKGPCCNFEVHL